MDLPTRSAVCCIALAFAAAPRTNHGNDPFFQISTAVAHCPTPLGPVQTDQEWLGDAHYRIERGNSCWVEGRCRLSNAYRYDAEIVDAVQRRLNAINPATHWRENSTLWLTLQRRFIYVQGCVSKEFDTAKFLTMLGETADVEQVIDNTTASPGKRPLPYKTPAD
ncbi:hypothetical protein AWB64_01386 [Caballeronia sordidicola]|uniref:BON domain-containing protein n=1 Tax=Caballeronia sordidicola TaxID=196367 RepID=A0A158FJD2_CABSO|nr:hypothetical protein [Caballeronia sordidicola]SAL19982.1 hypothetical protein AWB64_01386 [Caballeronia sordidicola]